MVFQTGNLDAEPRINPEATKYPSIASIIAKQHGSNQSGIPPYVGFFRSRSHIAFGGYLGQQYDPFPGNLAAKLPTYDLVGNDTGKVSEGEMFQLSKGLSFERIQNRRQLLADLDRMRRDIDQTDTMRAIDSHQQQAYELLLGKETREAFDLSLEPEQTRERKIRCRGIGKRKESGTDSGPATSNFLLKGRCLHTVLDVSRRQLPVQEMGSAMVRNLQVPNHESRTKLLSYRIFCNQHRHGLYRVRLNCRYLCCTAVEEFLHPGCIQSQ
jgi:hypothetical protein